MMVSVISIIDFLKVNHEFSPPEWTLAWRLLCRQVQDRVLFSTSELDNCFPNSQKTYANKML